jgi:hypothetical protein
MVCSFSALVANATHAPTTDAPVARLRASLLPPQRLPNDLELTGCSPGRRGPVVAASSLPRSSAAPPCPAVPTRSRVGGVGTSDGRRLARSLAVRRPFGPTPSSRCSACGRRLTCGLGLGARETKNEKPGSPPTAERQRRSPLRSDPNHGCSIGSEPMSSCY